MRYRIVHATRYSYERPVVVSHSLAMLRPRVTPHQSLLSFDLRIEPRPSRITQGEDDFGNPFTTFDLDQAYRHFELVAQSDVEVRPAPARSGRTGWEQVARELASTGGPPGVRAARAFTFASPNVPIHPDLAELARPAFSAGREVIQGATALMGHIHQTFQFDPAATTVATPVEEVLRRRRGVCQDFSHVMLGALRSLGLAARYVSGYLLTHPPAGSTQRLVGADASHAWLSVFSPDAGWVDLDPTNNISPREEHITLAWGRDFQDISPVRAVVLGGGEHRLEVGVDVTPLKLAGGWSPDRLPT